MLLTKKTRNEAKNLKLEFYLLMEFYNLIKTIEKRINTRISNYEKEFLEDYSNWTGEVIEQEDRKLGVNQLLKTKDVSLIHSNFYN
jgi:hypothetical protein